MTRKNKMCVLASDSRGAAALEFGLLAPTFIALLLGVLQIGLGVQSYNAVRNLTSDVSRHAMVEYAKGNRMTNSNLEEYAELPTTLAPYLLSTSRISATVVDAPVQRVSGAREMTLTVSYQVPSLLSSVGLEGPTLNYSRPLFIV